LYVFVHFVVYVGNRKSQDETKRWGHLFGRKWHDVFVSWWRRKKIMMWLLKLKQTLLNIVYLF